MFIVKIIRGFIWYKKLFFKISLRVLIFKNSIYFLEEKKKRLNVIVLLMKIILFMWYINKDKRYL